MYLHKGTALQESFFEIINKRLSGSVVTTIEKEKSQSNVDKKFGNNTVPPGTLGNPLHWVEIFEKSPIFKYERKYQLSCSIHTSNVTHTGCSVTLVNTFQESWVQYLSLQEGCRAAGIEDFTNIIQEQCQDVAQKINLSYTLPIILTVRYFGDIHVLFDDIIIQKSKYRLCSIIRFLPDIKHFIAYLRYGDTWYFYNDIGPVVEEVIIDTEKDLMGERLLFYYSKINEE